MVYKERAFTLNGIQYHIEATYNRPSLEISGTVRTDDGNECRFADQMSPHPGSIHLNGAVCELGSTKLEVSASGEVCKSYTGIMAFCVSDKKHVTEVILPSRAMSFEQFARAEQAKTSPHQGHHHKSHQSHQHRRHLHHFRAHNLTGGESDEAGEAYPTFADGQYSRE